MPYHLSTADIAPPSFRLNWAVALPTPLRWTTACNRRYSPSPDWPSPWPQVWCGIPWDMSACGLAWVLACY